MDEKVLVIKKNEHNDDDIKYIEYELFMKMIYFTFNKIYNKHIKELPSKLIEK